MTFFLVVLIVVTNVALTSAAWNLRGVLAEHETRRIRDEADDLAKVLSEALDDRLAADIRWANTEYRAINAEDRLREHGIAL